MNTHRRLHWAPPRTPRAPKGRAGPRGFTLIEIMVTVAIFGVLVALASNSLTGTVSNMKRENAAQLIAGFIARARVEAVKGHARVELDTTEKNAIKLNKCPARYGSNLCVTGESLTNIPELFVRVRSDATEGVTMTAPASTLIFNSRGFPETAATYEFSVKHSVSPSTIRKVIVTAAGEVRIE